MEDAKGIGFPSFNSEKYAIQTCSGIIFIII